MSDSHSFLLYLFCSVQSVAPVTEHIWCTMQNFLRAANVMLWSNALYVINSVIYVQTQISKMVFCSNCWYSRFSPEGTLK